MADRFQVGHEITIRTSWGRYLWNRSEKVDEMGQIKLVLTENIDMQHEPQLDVSWGRVKITLELGPDDMYFNEKL